MNLGQWAILYFITVFYILETAKRPNGPLTPTFFFLAFWSMLTVDSLTISPLLEVQASSTLLIKKNIFVIYLWT